MKSVTGEEMAKEKTWRKTGEGRGSISRKLTDRRRRKDEMGGGK